MVSPGGQIQDFSTYMDDIIITFHAKCFYPFPMIKRFKLVNYCHITHIYIENTEFDPLG